MDKLFIIIPAYNEEMNIRPVAVQWHEITVKTGTESKLVIIDDGSKDKTWAVLKELSLELPQLIPFTKPNGGHGAAVLFGYNYALKQGADYIFQTDSDGQTLPDEFWPFWEQRNNYSAIIGYRKRRQDGISRIVVTKVLKFIIFCVFHLRIPDANTPFRLIQAKTLQKHIEKIPRDFNLSNVMLTVCFAKYHETIKFIPITFKPRQGGVNSLDFKKILKIGMNLPALKGGVSPKRCKIEEVRSARKFLYCEVYYHVF
jgi:glycosyltransferase involved in cell wall biosynthesis